MIPSWNDLAVAEEHRRDLLREAAELRRRAVGAEPIARPGAVPRALARLGRLMIAWGARLQELEAAPAKQV